MDQETGAASLLMQARQLVDGKFNSSELKQVSLLYCNWVLQESSAIILHGGTGVLQFPIHKMVAGNKNL